MNSNEFKLHQSTLPAGALVVVTGSNGYVGSHVVNTLLQLGFRVRGIVRDVRRCSWMNEVFHARYGLEYFELAEVQDLTIVEALYNAFQDACGIVHCAADTTFGKDAKGIILKSIEGVVCALSAAKASSSVKTFVLTSSSGALYTPGSDENNSQIVNKSTWNDRAVAYVNYLITPIGQEVSNPAPGVPDEFLIYSASKTLAERTFFEWVNREKPQFVANSVIPAMNTGEIISYENQGFPSSSGMVASLFQASSWEDPKAQFLKFLPAQWWIDVEDDARLHVAVLVHPSLQNERIFAFHRRCNVNDFLQAFVRMCPEQKFPERIDYGTRADDSHNAEQEVLRAKKILKDVGFDGFVVDMEESLTRQLRPLTYHQQR